MTSTTNNASKTEATAIADALLSNVGLPTYIEMFRAIEHLYGHCWLDSAPCETEDLGLAKARARKTYEAAKSSFPHLPASQT